MNEEARTSRRNTRLQIATIGFPVVLWFVAMFFLLGDLGRLNDDWFYVQRVPETGAVRSLVLDHPVHFWRPLYRVIVPALETLLWRHEWVNHLILVLAHGLNAWLLWRLLSALGVRRMAAAISGLAFMVAPWHFEVVFWLCNVPTSLSAGVMLAAMLVTVHWARSGAGWWIVSFAAAATFASACLNEQPTMMIGTLPLVALCAAPRPVTRRILVRSVVGAGAGAATMVLYTMLHMRFVGPEMDIGGGHGVLPLDRWPASVEKTISWVRGFVGSTEWSQRAWQCARRVFEEFPVRSAIGGCGALICGTLWVREMARHGHEQHAACEEQATCPMYLGLLGAAIIVLAAVPVVVFEYWKMPRMVYAPAIGAAVLLASGFSAVAELSQKRLSGLVRSRAVIGSVAAAAFVVQAVLMVGVQEGYRRRDRLDRASLAELVAQAPDPGERAVLIPAKVEFPDTQKSTATFEFELYYWSVFASWWSSEFAIRLAYQRSDLRAGYAGWGQSGWSNPSSGSVVVTSVGEIPWARAIPFTLDATGHVHLVTHVRFVNHGQVTEVALPQAARFIEQGTAVANIYTFPAKRP